MNTGLPLDFYPDGLPIFLRGDFIRSPQTTIPSHGVIYENLVLPEHLHLHPKLSFNLAIIPPINDFEISSKELLEEVFSSIHIQIVKLDAHFNFVHCSFIKCT